MVNGVSMNDPYLNALLQTSDYYFQLQQEKLQAAQQANGNAQTAAPAQTTTQQNTNVNFGQAEAQEKKGKGGRIAAAVSILTAAGAIYGLYRKGGANHANIKEICSSIKKGGKDVWSSVSKFCTNAWKNLTKEN